ncbi:PE-PGRS family protein [Tomitella gaofuii]|uniref:PE-PGRS family protein n=1 Tax=Tomitella gaofuii TaxID=2760083 RepID=UPI0015F82B0A|nr:PE-PGRS family protein [Tomitella gaofuii]
MATVDPHYIAASLPACMTAIARHTPEPVREHWCDVDGVRYPAKQAYQVLTGLPRSQFTSHQALRQLRSVGFIASEYRRRAPEQNHGDSAPSAFTILSGYLAEHALTDQIGDAEEALLGADAESTRQIVEDYRFSEDLLDAALEVRTQVGRLNAVIHATCIARVLPLILEPGETISARPSLAAGNDPGRPFDLETDRRVAEFKISQWKGADAMRKRAAFKDLVHLALDESGRRPELYIVGPAPERFLSASATTAEWALNRAGPRIRQRFREAYGDPAEMTVADFRRGPAAHVAIVDMSSLLPSLA